MTTTRSPAPASHALRPTPAPVHLVDGDGPSAALTEVLASAPAAAGDVDASLELARRLGAVLPGPGTGRTAELWEVLAGLGALDLTTARVVEPHLDALAILEQAGVAEVPPGSTWGVFAAEGPGGRLEAARHDGGWRLDGVKPWCSLADRLSHAVVTAHTAPGRRRAFAVDLQQPGVTSDAGPWVPRGLRDVTSLATRFEAAVARPVGEDDWYLARPGFAWGGMGVAAIWFGAATALARALVEAARRREPDQVALVHLGAADTALYAARLALQAAATDVDAGRAQGRAGALLAARLRGLVAGTAESLLVRVGHALGPAPLTADARHAARVADLTVYLRQHHAERDDAALGSLLLADGGPSW